MDNDKIIFWKKEGWGNGITKLVFILFLFVIILIIHSYISQKIVWYFLGVDLISVGGMVIPITLIFYSFSKRKFMIREYLKEIGLTKVNKKVILVGLVLTLLGLFAIVLSFHVRNAALASVLGLKTDILKTLSQTYTLLLVQIVSVAIWEEMFFRGYVQNFLESYFSEKISRFSGIASVILTSIIFAFFHFGSFEMLTFNIRFLNIFFGSIVIGIAYYYTKNLWIAIFVHGGYNVLQSIVQIFINDRSALVSNVFFNELISNGVTSDVAKNVVDAMSKLMGS